MSGASESDKLAGRLFASAFGFHLAAKHITDGNWPENAGQKFEPWPLFYTNLGYALELSLKAYIAFRGGTECEIKREIGHDLEKALRRTVKLGLKSPDEAVLQVIRAVGPYHKDRSFVYLGNIDEKSLPNFGEAIASSCSLFCSIAAQMPINDLIIL